ncbi:MAG TPA: hypothetical protein VGM26_14540 [Rhizomicrobium sp.]
MSNSGRKEYVHQHSGWVIPLAVVFAILLLSGLFLGWYLRPGPRTTGAPTGRANIVALTVQGTPFAIPANYIESSAARAGGAQNTLTLAALFPSFRGYSEDEAKSFAGNAPDSPIVHLVLRGDPNNLDSNARLTRIYMPYIVDAKGAAGPFALTQYTFRASSGYDQSELFAGQSDQGLLLLLCERASTELPSPNCIAIDRPLTPGLSLSYRFKRAYLARWREIASGVNGLVKRFEIKA